jgi:SRSO17 transposase
MQTIILQLSDCSRSPDFAWRTGTIGLSYPSHHYLGIHSNAGIALSAGLRQVRTKKILSGQVKDPISIKSLAAGINNFFWYRRKVSEGAKGPIEYEFTKRRIVLSHEGLPGRTVWLLVRRTLSKEPQYSYFISNAPISVRLPTLVWLSGLRWSVEQCFEETKTELGMDQYEVRKFPGWHHHILTCMLGHYFLWHLKIRLGKKSTSYYALAA